MAHIMRITMKKQDSKSLSLGRALAQLRESRGVSQEKLEEISGIPRRTIQNIEYGVVKEPKLAVVRKILNALESGFAGLGIDIGDYQIVGDTEPTLTFAPQKQDPVPPDRAAEILRDLEVLLQKYSRAPEARRLLALYVITLRESYLARYEALPNSDRQVSATLRRSLGTS
jgi:transcriptional regulator with XRE-family HTH domain